MYLQWYIRLVTATSRQLWTIFKFISLDNLAAKKSGIMDWRRHFCELVRKQSVYLEGNALQNSYRIQFTQG